MYRSRRSKNQALNPLRAPLSKAPATVVSSLNVIEASLLAPDARDLAYPGHPRWPEPASGAVIVRCVPHEIRFCATSAGRVAYTAVGEGPPLVFPAWWVSHQEVL